MAVNKVNSSWMKHALIIVSSHLNFYRIHLLFFTTFPVVFAAIFYASNGRFFVEYIDALFVCVSAMTGTGLATIDLSSLTAWQQTIIVFLELVGNTAFVSWVVVVVRRSYYRKHLKEYLRNQDRRNGPRRSASVAAVAFPVPTSHQASSSRDLIHTRAVGEVRHRPTLTRISPDIIRRVDVAPHRIGPSGVANSGLSPTIPSPQVPPLPPQIPSPRRTSTVELRAVTHVPLTQTRVSALEQQVRVAGNEADFGGFPGPHDLLSRFFRKLFPKFHKEINRTFTMPRTQTLVPHDSVDPTDTSGPLTRIPYFSFRTVVGKNSEFHGLTKDQLNELGGVEYRALNTLLWVVPLYYVGLVAVAIVVITPYMCLPQWKSNFLPPQQHRKISPVWFSIFQVIGAWSNTGMSLVDQNLLPFQKAYLLVVVSFFCGLAGNTAFPIFLRLTIWLLKRAFPPRSSTQESLLFLLHHPRRCFITLFPARQTWLLVAIVFAFITVTLVGSLVLNIGNPVVEAIPIGTRIILGILQTAATRSAGFQPIPLAGQYPAALVLYIISMYIAIYPVAISVRSTNVYEERSLGVYPAETIDSFAGIDPSEHRVAIWGKYVLRHTRRQLSFDMWWLALAVFLISIVERRGLTDPSKESWLNLFALIFEIVSAYGTVGLSLGVPGQSYSLSGALHPISRLIICVVMLRGRHRGLPVALDRAVTLPEEFRKQERANQRGQAMTSVATSPRILRRPTMDREATSDEGREVCVDDIAEKLEDRSSGPEAPSSSSSSSKEQITRDRYIVNAE